jgi:hypothetical protein
MIFAAAQSLSDEAPEPGIIPLFIDHGKVVNLRNAGFPRARVKRLTNRGTEYWLEEIVGVPKIPTNFLDGVFYLYSDRAAAESGEKYGGTGFFVGVPCREQPNAHYVYAVSNWHVAVKGGFSVLRVNSTDGPPEIIELGPENWEFDPRSGHDIAVAELPLSVPSHCKFSIVETPALVTADKFSPAQENALGVGDDTFMVGRFVDHDGGPTNQPAARFGHISIGPSKLRGVFNKDVDMICLDTNSRTGFSGSPVYVYRTMVGDLEQLAKPEIQGQLLIAKGATLMLLGVHTGQFPEWWAAEDAREAQADGTEEASQGQVRGLSGMTRVAPAWGIQEILDLPKFKDRREIADNEFARQMNVGAAILASGHD